MSGMAEADHTGLTQSQATTGLRQVVAEGGEDHVVDTVRRTAFAGPGVSDHIGVLRAPLNPTLGPVVNLHPEAERAFQYVPGITRTTRQRTGEKAAR